MNTQFQIVLMFLINNRISNSLLCIIILTHLNILINAFIYCINIYVIEMIQLHKYICKMYILFAHIYIVDDMYNRQAGRIIYWTINKRHLLSIVNENQSILYLQFSLFSIQSFFIYFTWVYFTFATLYVWIVCVTYTLINLCIKRFSRYIRKGSYKYFFFPTFSSTFLPFYYVNTRYSFLTPFFF